MDFLRNILNLKTTSRLCKASKAGCLEKVKLFIEKKGANINGNERKNPLIIAILNGKYVVAKYLIKNGADINAKTESWTPIHAAVENGRCTLFFSVKSNSPKKKIISFFREINSTKKKSFTKKTDFICVSMKPISRIFSYLYSFRSP